MRLTVVDLIVVSCCIAGDVVTGLIAAWLNHSFQSSKMREGASHKVGELLAMGIVYGVQWGLPYLGVTSTINFVRFFALYIVVMEVASMCENIVSLDPELSGPLGHLIDTLRGVLNRDE